MPSMIPTLGYASRTEAVVALLAQGLNEKQVGKKLNLSTSVVYALAQSAARRKGNRRPRDLDKGRTVVFSVEVLDALRPEANKRLITVNELVRQIVECVADEKLVQAILDD